RIRLAAGAQQPRLVVGPQLHAGDVELHRRRQPDRRGGKRRARPLPHPHPPAPHPPPPPPRPPPDPRPGAPPPPPPPPHPPSAPPSDPAGAPGPSRALSSDRRAARRAMKPPNFASPRSLWSCASVTRVPDSPAGSSRTSVSDHSRIPSNGVPATSWRQLRSA